MDYSPLLAGFSIVLKDGRAAFLTSSNLKFDPNVSHTFLSFLIDLFYKIYFFYLLPYSKSVAFGRKVLRMQRAPLSTTNIASSLSEERSEYLFVQFLSRLF